MNALLNPNLGKKYLGGGASPSQGAVGGGGGQKPSSGISAIQQKYPAATNAISLMQKTLGDLSSSISLRLSSPKAAQDPKIAERKRLALAIRGTQAGRELQSTDDGVWNQNTENALKALQQYVKVSYPKENIGIDNLRTQKIPVQLMGSEQQISQIVANNLRIIAKVFALEGDTRFLENTITTSEVLDELPKTYEEAKDPTKIGPTPIKVADLGRLIDAKNAVGGEGFMQSGTSNPANLQVFKETAGQSEFKIKEITTQDLIDFVTQGGKVIGNLHDFMEQERNRVINSVAQSVQRRTGHAPAANMIEHINNVFNKYKPSKMQPFSESYVSLFYNRILPEIFAPSTSGLGGLPVEEQPLLAWLQQNRLDAVTGKSFFYYEAAEKAVKQIKANPNQLYTLPGASNFFAAKQNERASGGSYWTYSNYKLLVEMFVNRSQEQLRKAKGESGARTAVLINNIIKEAQDPAPAESSKLSVPIKQTYVRLAKELEAQLVKLRSEIIKRFNAKFGQMDESTLNGMSVPDSYLQSLGEKMREGQSLAAEKQRTQQMQGSQGRQGAGAGAGAAGGYGGRSGAGYGESGETQGPPNVNLPPVAPRLFLDQLSRWANVTGQAVPLADYWPPALQLGQFATERTRQQIRSVFSNSREAVDFLTSVNSMIGPALNNWKNALQAEVASGRKTQANVNDLIGTASDYYAKWANSLNYAASEFNIPPKPRR